jgi:ribosomal-protein-alanine N-acetyltransferase
MGWYHWPVHSLPPPRLRRGTPDDASAVLALFDEAVAWLAARGRTDQWGAQPFSERPPARTMVDRIAGSDGFVVAVEPVEGGERVVGAIVVEDHPTTYVAGAAEPERFIHLLITSRTAAGRGLGQLLLTHARDRCRRERVELLRVDCFGGGDRRLVAWYESQGFVTTDSLDVDDWPGQVLEQRVPRFDELRTQRLLLRDWRPDDLAPFAALNADPAVMEHFPGLQDRATSDASVNRFREHLDEHGWGFWALERLDTGEFIGFTGLNTVPSDVPLSPGIEVGWRLARAQWGLGFATEAARAALDVAFYGIGAREIVSFTSHANERSQAVMRRIGLHRRPSADFDHPRFPNWPGRRHVVYAATAEQWREGGRSSAPAAGTVGS